MKNYVEEYDVLDTPKEILDGKAVLRRYHNKGAFLNFGEQKRKLVTLLSVLLTVAVLVVFVLTLGMRGKKLLKAGLSLLLGGAFSNTYDRVMREYVVDYVSLKTGIAAIDRVVFNLADLCILIARWRWCWVRVDCNKQCLQFIVDKTGETDYYTYKHIKKIGLKKRRIYAQFRRHRIFTEPNDL